MHAPSPPAPQPTPLLPRWLPHGAAVLFIATLIGLLGGLAVWEERQRHREQAETTTRHVAHLLDLHLSGIFDKVDVVLQSTVAQYQEQLAGGALRPRELTRYLERQKALVPELLSLRIIDKDGIIRYGAGLPADTPVNVSDRDYFSAARDAQPARLVVGGPHMGRIARQWIIVLARRIEGPDGRFAGVVYAAVPTEHFNYVLASAALGPKGAATLRTADLALVHRVPMVVNGIGSRQVSPALQRSLARAPEEGQYLAAAAVDGIERSNAYRRLQHYPFYVIVGMATADYLADWQQHSLFLASLALLAALGTAAAAALMYRSAERLRRDLAERKDIAQELESLVDERTRLATELAVRADEAEAANRAKSAFLATVSHELRTPLNHIMGFTSILEKEVAGPRGLDHLHKVSQASRRLLELIETLLSVTSSQSDGITLALRPFSLAELLQRACAGVAEAAAGKGLEVRLESDPGLPETLLGDPERIAQVLNGLLDNAVKFSTRGPLELRLGRATGRDGTTRVRFEVQDRGIGIAPEQQAHLFEIFMQGDGSSTRRYGGAGLGLSLCKRLVALMQGEIGFTSAADQGSTFWFELPLAAADHGLPPPGREDWPRIRHLLAELEALLAAGNFQALTLWHRYGPLLRAALGPAAERCGEAIERIDYGAAREHLQQARNAIPPAGQ